METVGRDQLRKGRARAVDARVARRRAGTLPQRPGRDRMSAASAETRTSALDLAERALAETSAGDGALASVTSERSLLLRYARSRPTQATAVEDSTISITVLRDGHIGSASTNRDDRESLAACARAAEAAAETAARTSGAGTYPGFPAPQPIRPHDGFDAETAAMEPDVGGDALATAFRVAAEHGVEAHGVWSTGDVEAAIVSSTGTAVMDRLTDAF